MTTEPVMLPDTLTPWPKNERGWMEKWVRENMLAAVLADRQSRAPTTIEGDAYTGYMIGMADGVDAARAQPSTRQAERIARLQEAIKNEGLELTADFAEFVLRYVDGGTAAALDTTKERST